MVRGRVGVGVIGGWRPRAALLAEDEAVPAGEVEGGQVVDISSSVAAQVPAMASQITQTAWASVSSAGTVLGVLGAS
jgi:hypothetical protein